MGKSKDAAKKDIVPSTTRRGTDLPSRPHFSPNAATTPAPKKKTTVLASSPLSRMSTSTEKDLLDDGQDKEGTPDLSKSLSNNDIEFEHDKNELVKENDIDASSKETPSEEDIAFTKAFMSLDLDDLDKFEASLSTFALGELFPVASKCNEPAIFIKDKDYEFEVNPEIIERVEASKFYGKDEEHPYEHLMNLDDIACLFGKTEIQQRYYFLKLFPFSLGGEAKTWYNSLAPKSITSKEACLYSFFHKYLSDSKIHAMKIEISNFAQNKEESIPQAWGRFCAIKKRCPAHGFKDNELLDAFYNGLTESSRTYLDSIAGNIFRNRTIEEAKGLLNTITQNYYDWHIEEEEKSEKIHNKRGIHKLSNEDMEEAHKSMKEKGIKSSHLKEFSEMGVKFPIDQPCFPIQVHAICSSESNEKVSPPTEISYVDRSNNFAYHQAGFDHNIEREIIENSHRINDLHKKMGSCVDSLKMTIKHCKMMNNQVEQMISLQNKLYEKLLNEKKQIYGVNTRGGSSTQDPDYPEGHPKRQEQEARKKKSIAGKSPNKANGNSEDQENDVSLSDAETEDNNHEEDNEEISQPNEELHEDENNEESEPIAREDPQSSNDKSKKKKPQPQPKGKERDPWVQRSIPYPQEVMKTLDDARFEKFIELIKNLYLQIPLVDAIKIPPYSKYMKEIVNNKRKIPNEAITAMLADYSFKGKLPEKRGDPGIPTIPCTIKNTYVKYALCDLGAGVSVMPFSLYKKLNLNKLVPTEVSLQMADKSTAIPVGICEDVPVMIANVQIPIDFVILEMPEDDNLSIILGRPFLNTAGAVINCTESKVTFNVKGKEHTIYFPKKNSIELPKKSVNYIEPRFIIVGSFEIPIPPPIPKYQTIMVGTIPIFCEVS